MIQKIPSYAACLDMTTTARGSHEGIRGDTRGSATLETGISVEHVSFSFEVERPVLRDISLHLPATGLVFFTGPSGSGKTTIVDIILGLLKPESRGRVSVDGRDLNEIDETSWRKCVAYVPQDVYILSGTLREYLTFGSVDVSDGWIWEALERAGASAFVRAAPLGLDTVVGSGGVDFSGGERQRLSVSRALVRDAKLLVLDEPSSSLDKETERTLFDSLRTLSRDILILVVTHSTSMIRATDRVYRLSHDGQGPKPFAITNLVLEHE